MSRFDPSGLEGIGYWTFPPGPQRDAFERRFRGCDEDEDCVARCIQEYYGNSYDTALDLSPFSLASLAMDEATELLDTAAKREATRNLNSPNYYTGKRQMRLLKVFRGFNAVGAVVGVGAGAFVVGAKGYCTVRCALE